VGLCLWAIYPPDQKIRLGLDLKGGVHLVLRVHTDDALRLESATTADRLREDLERAGVKFGAVTTLDPLRFQVANVDPSTDAIFRETTAGLLNLYNRSASGAGTYIFELKPNEAQRLREQAVTVARQTIERRVNELGVVEPLVAQQGSQGDQLLVQMPGVTEVNHAKQIISNTALLELKLVEQGPMPTKEALLQATGGKIPNDMEILPGIESAEPGQPAGTVYYLVRKVPIVTGKDLRTAKPSIDDTNQPAVSFTLNSAGAARFGKATGENIGRRLAIVLDSTIRSAPSIEGRITDSGIIHGSFTQQEAQDLSLVLRSGALPARLTYLEERTIGPTLGHDSIRAGVTASLVGLGLVVLFLLFYYKLSGTNAILALVLNLIILLGAMSYLGATWTLPGIAGFILTIGMGVDSNVLIFERIKEELAAQRGARTALNSAFSRVFLTLLDTHIAALISAAFLFQFGTGPIRGFATTLTFGLLSNLFTSTFVSKTLFEAVLSRRQAQTISI
jgi:preprotein translocase subunit SecD